MATHIYKTIFYIYALIMRFLNKEIVAVWYRNSLYFNNITFGKSDIDITIITKQNIPNILCEIAKWHRKIKRIFPIIGELQLYSLENQETLLKCVNYYELQRDPELIKYFSVKKNKKTADDLVFLCKFLISNINSYQERTLSKKKIEFMTELIGRKMNTLEQIQEFLLIKYNLDLEILIRKYLIDKTSNTSSNYSNLELALLYNTICHKKHFRSLNAFEKACLIRNIEWEIWGIFTHQYFTHQREIISHLNNIIFNCDNLLNHEEIASLKDHVNKIYHNLALK